MEEDGFVDVSAMMHCLVYALLRRGKVVYVGQSKTPLRRLYEHMKTQGKAKDPLYGTSVYKGMVFDAIWIRPCMLAELSKIEMAAIAKHQPKYNVAGKLKVPPVPIEELIRLLPAVDNVAKAVATPRPSVYRRF
jgi:GIY-YIG catalytic domain